MSNLVSIKSNQFVHLEGQKTGTSYNINNIVYYLPRTINQLTKLIGNDVVLRGMDLDASLDRSTNTITITIGPGVFIADQTLIESLYINTIDITNIDSYITNGHFVVYVQFQYLQTINTNAVKYGITFVNDSGHASESWDHNKNRLVLDFYRYDPVNKSLTMNTNQYLLIENKEYYKCGYNPNEMTLSSYMMNFLKMAGATNSSTGTSNIITNDFQVLGKFTCGNDIIDHGKLSVDNTATFNADVHIKDDLQVYGNRLLVDSNDVQFGSQSLILNRNQLNGYGTPSKYSGLKINRGLDSPAILYYDEDNDNWIVGTEDKNFVIGQNTSTGGTIDLTHNNIIDWVQQLTVDFNTFFESKTTDDLKQGNNHLYFNEQVLYNQLYNILKSGSGITFDTTAAGSIKIISTPATYTQLGSVIVGNNLNIDSSGRLSATLQSEENFTTALKQKLENIVSSDIPDSLSPTIIQTDSTHRFITDEQINKLNTLTLYVLPKASNTTLGGVSIGNNIAVDVNGKISVPLATKMNPGVIIPGDGLDIDNNGVINVINSVNNSIATKEFPGMVQIGDNLNIDETGLLSVNNASEDIPGVITIDPTQFTINDDGQLHLNTSIPEISLFDISPSIAQKGSTVTSIALTWVCTSQPNKISINDSILTDNTLQHIEFKNLNITTDRTYTLKVYGLLSRDIFERQLVFGNYMFYGNSKIEDINQLVLSSLDTKILVSDIYNKEISVNNITDYFYLAYPKCLGKCDFYFGNNTYGGFDDPYVLPFTNVYNYTELYYIYKTTRKTLNTLNFTIIKEL